MDEDILAALDKTHARLAQSVGAGSHTAAATWEDLLAKEQVEPIDLTLSATSCTEPTLSRAPAPAAGRGEDGLVGTKQYNSADLLAAFDTASAGGSAAEQQGVATATQGAATTPPQDRQRAALLCEEAANHRSATMPATLCSQVVTLPYVARL